MHDPDIFGISEIFPKSTRFSLHYSELNLIEYDDGLDGLTQGQGQEKEGSVSMRSFTCGQ